jgi:coenzyme F420 hydrogenase subunit beta
LGQRIKTLQDVVDWGLCTGCGACYSACAEGGVSLVNIESVGIRPKFDAACASCKKCLPICPGYTLDGDLPGQALPKDTERYNEFGPALEIWEGHASDSEIRHSASSGGVLSALSVYCLEQEDMAFVVHSAMDQSQPYLNATVQSHTRAEILSRSGSRYAPASPCDGLTAVEKSDKPCVFIGKPCDTAAVGMLRRTRPELDRNLGLVLTFFCAGTPSTTGTLDLLKEMGISRESVDRVRYRGEGWPGSFKILHDGGKQERSMSYEESWGKLSHYRPLRCHLCPDGLGQVADVSCGDAWESFDQNGNPGRSIVIVRTPRGREIVRRAMAANYVQLTPATAENILAAQPNLLQKRKELLGRLLGLRLFMVPVPRFRGFSLFQGWMRLPLLQKGRSFLSTVKRVMTRGLWRRRPLFVR